MTCPITESHSADCSTQRDRGHRSCGRRSLFSYNQPTNECRTKMTMPSVRWYRSAQRRLSVEKLEHDECRFKWSAVELVAKAGKKTRKQDARKKNYDNFWRPTFLWWLMLNSTVGTKRLHRATSVWNVYCVAPRRHSNINKPNKKKKQSLQPGLCGGNLELSFSLRFNGHFSRWT